VDSPTRNSRPSRPLRIVPEAPGFDAPKPLRARVAARGWRSCRIRFPWAILLPAFPNPCCFFAKAEDSEQIAQTASQKRLSKLPSKGGKSHQIFQLSCDLRPASIRSARMETMRPVFEFLDYREVLKEAYEERKSESPLFSYRVLADFLGLDPSNVFRILQRDAHLPARVQSRAIEFIGLSGRSAEYFLLLIAYARERNSKARMEILEKAMALRDVSRRKLEERELAYYENWWVVAVRSMLEVVDGRFRPAEIAARLSPAVTEAEVAKAMELLLDLGLAKKASSGRFVISDAHLTAGGEEKTEAVRSYQRQILSLASESLARFPKDHRDVSTIAFAVDQDAFREIREMLRECRRQIQKRIEDSKKPDRVIQLAMALFPLAPALEVDA